MSANIHRYNIGVAFRGTVKDQDENVMDISAATTKEIIFAKPGGTVVTKTASFYTDGTDGIIQYISQSGDLDVVGNWKQQAYVIQSGSAFYSDIISFQVIGNLNDGSDC